MSLRTTITAALATIIVVASSLNGAGAVPRSLDAVPTASIHTGIHQPGISMVAGTKLWIPGRETNSVVVIDTTTNTVAAVLKARNYHFSTPGQVIDLGGSAAVINAVTGSITVINETNYGVVRIISSAVSGIANPGVAAFAGGGLWIPERLQNDVVDLNWRTGKVIRILQGKSTGLASPQFAIANGRLLYIVNQKSNLINVVDGATGAIRALWRSPNFHLVSADLFGLPALISSTLWLPLHLTNTKSLLVGVATSNGAVTAVIGDATSGLAYPITIASVGTNLAVMNPVKLESVAAVGSDIATSVGDVASIHAAGEGHLPTRRDVLAAISLLAPSVPEASISLASVTFAKGTGVMDLHLTFSNSSYNNGATFTYPACATVPANATTTASKSVPCAPTDPVPTLPEPPGNSITVLNGTTFAPLGMILGTGGPFESPRSMVVVGTTAYVTCATGAVIATDPTLGLHTP